MKEIIFDKSKMLSHDYLVDLLEEMVSIKSVSNLPALNRRVQNIMARELRKTGMKVKMIETNSKKYAPLLVAESKGKESKYITLLAHSDVVNASEDFKGMTFNKNFTQAHGPGVIDCKGGAVIAIAAIKAFLASNPNPKFPIRFISSPSEELGSPLLHKKLADYGKQSKVLLSYEAAFPNGNFVGSRSGNRWYSIEIFGRQAHSGRQFSKGVNAVEAMSYKLAQLCKLTNVAAGTTITPTHIEAPGASFNTIPPYCKAYLDTRFETNEHGDKLHTAIIGILKTVEVTAYSDFKAAHLVVEIVDYSPALSRKDLDHQFCEYYETVIKKLEKKDIVGEISHGSADCNLMVTPEVIFLGGMGAVGSGQHTPKEVLNVSSLLTRAQASAYILQFANKML